MKKILGFVLTIALLFIVSACAGNKTQTLLDAAKEKLAVTYSNGDSENSVTKRVTLVTKGINDTVITWSSSDTNVIANDGSVTRPTFEEGDKQVTLTATLMLKDLTATKTFNLTVKATPKTDAAKLQEAASSLDLTFAQGETNNTVKSNIPFPTTEGEATVTWASSKENVVSTAGVVTRPKFGQANATVVLTATLTVGSETTTKEFIVVVLANENILDEDAVADTKSKIIILNGESRAEATFELPVTGTNQTTISWVSSNPAAIEVTTDTLGNGIKAKVTRPAFGESDVTVTLTATISKGNASETKEFVLTVPAITTAPIPATPISQVLLGSKGDGFTVEGVVFGKNLDGYYLADDSGFLFVYTTVELNNIQVGDKVKVTGKLDIYFDQPELATITTTEIVSSGNTLPQPTVTSIYDIVNSSTKNRSVYAKYVQIQGVVKVEVSGTFTNTFIEDFAGNRVKVYYKSQETPVRDFNGKTVTMNVIVHAFHSTENNWRVSFANNAGDIAEVTVTDAEKLNYVKNALTIPNANNIAGKINLPTSLNGFTITWSSSNTAVVANDGTVVRPAAGEANVDLTLTATISIGTETPVTKTIELTVLAENPISIADAKTKADGTIVTIKAFVTEIAGNNAYVQDATGAIYLYVGSTANTNLVIGNEVIVTGELDIYNNLYQVRSIASVKVVTTGNTLPEVVTYNTIAELLAAKPLSQIVRLNGLTITEVKAPSTAGNSYSVIATLGTETIEIRVDKYTLPYIEPTSFTVGKKVNVVAPLGVYNTTYQLMIVSIEDMTETPLTDAEKLVNANSALTIPNATSVAGNLTLPTDLNGVTITWTSSNPAVVAVDGTVVRPAAGEANVDVTLTATLSIGSETPVTKDIVVTVLAETPIDISEALTKADGTIVTVKGLVTEKLGNNAYVQDPTGAIYLYTVANESLVIGNEVIVTGELDIYNNLYQIRNIASVKVVSTGNTLPTVVKYNSIAELLTAKPISQVVRLEGLTITEILAPSTAGNSYSIKVTDGSDTIEVRVDKYALPYIEPTNFTVGISLDITAPLAIFKTTYQLMAISLEDLTLGPVTDQIKLTNAKNALTLATETSESLTLPATSGDVAITWASDNTAVIANDGTVVRPAVGQSDVTVTLTATLTIGTLTETKVFPVVVKAEVASTGETLFYTTNFEDGAKTSYATASATLNGKSWTMTDALVGNASSDKKNELKSARIRAGFMQSEFTITGLTKVEFMHGSYGTDALGQTVVLVSLDGTTWVQITSIAQTSTLEQESVTIDYTNQLLVDAGITATSALYIKIQNTNSSTSARVNIDDLNIYVKQ